MSPSPGSTSPARDPLIGRVLNERFTILESIGGGTMGRVYRARQAPLDRIVAVKVLLRHAGVGHDPHFKRRFFMEASLTAQLRHPNTIQIIDYGEEGDELLFIAMEYLQGSTLADLLAREGRLPWPRALNILQQAARSLREAHGHGVIHRDLKPANLMLVHEEPGHDLVKVLDFGLVKAWREGSSLPQSNVQMTQAGVILGSAFYMAPEQAHGKGDPRTDVYALGVILFHLLAGRPPFEGQTSMDVIVQHHSRPVPALRDLVPGLDVPPQVEALLQRCLAKKPENRVQDMDALLEEIRALAPLSQGGPHVLRTTSPGLSRLPAPSSPTARTQTGAAPESPALFGTHRPERAGGLPVGWMIFAAALLIGVGVAVLVQSGEAPVEPIAVAPSTTTASAEAGALDAGAGTAERARGEAGDGALPGGDRTPGRERHRGSRARGGDPDALRATGGRGSRGQRGGPPLAGGLLPGDPAGLGDLRRGPRAPRVGAPGRDGGRTRPRPDAAPLDVSTDRERSPSRRGRWRGCRP